MEVEMQAHWERDLISLANVDTHPLPQPFFFYWAGDADLRAAYKHAEAVTREHSKSFYLASALLPEEKRSAVRALYAFCRTVDDIVDEAPQADCQSRLDYWRMVARTASVPDDEPIALAWVDTLLRYRIPRHYALQLIDGVARDMYQSTYQTFDDLATYCYGVASTVGLMSMYIVGFKSHEAIPYAIKLGVALQLTNILRDVGEDYRAGRIYLPQDELRAFGLSQADIAAGVVTAPWRAFMDFQIRRARQLYQQAWAGIKLLDADGQLAIGAASVFYQGILDKIEQYDYDVFTRRASLSAWEKMRRFPSLWWRIKRGDFG